MNLILSIFFLILSIILTKIFCVLADETRLMDKPNNRSMHLKPTIRGGGLIFIGLTLLSLPLLCYLTNTVTSVTWVFALSIVIIASVSFVDDLFQLSVKPRFFLQCVVALLVALLIIPAELNLGLFTMNRPLFIVPFVFVTLLWAINHFNFMDGLDGFCASQALFLFAAYSVLFTLYDVPFYQSFCFVLISCLCGFLIFNFPPAKLFMGDIGSATLGLISFGLALIAQQQAQIPIFYWFMLNALFLFDASCTLIRRIIKKEKWSTPHRLHAYQRLRQSGFSVRVILLGQLIINSTFFILVLMLNMHFFEAKFIICLQISVIFLIYYLVEKIFPMYHHPLTH